MRHCHAFRTSGEILKAHDPRLSPEAAAEAVDRLLRIDGLDLAVLVIDVSSQQSVSVFEKALFASDHVRGAKHERRISGPNLVYCFFTGHVVAAVWTKACGRHGQRLSYLDLILDEANLHRREQELFRAVVTNVSERSGIAYRAITWTSEEREPLLHVADLVAGIHNRRAAFDDVRDAIRLLERAREVGRISVDQGLKVQVPSGGECWKLFAVSKKLAPKKLFPQPPRR